MAVARNLCVGGKDNERRKRKSLRGSGGELPRKFPRKTPQKFKYVFWSLVFFNGGFLAGSGNCPPCPPASYGHPLCHKPFTPKSDQFQIPLQPHQKYYITQYEELGFT